MTLMNNSGHFQAFSPNADNSRAFRNALGQFGTGVTVITAMTDTGPIGMTVNSFASVSLDPALVLFSLAKSSKRLEPFSKVHHFAIHVLAQEQFDVCNAFARSAQAFDACDWRTSPHGVPLIEGCLTRLECSKQTVHDGGDHEIYVAKVDHVMTTDGAPLMFFGGKLGSFATAQAA